MFDHIFDMHHRYIPQYPCSQVVQVPDVGEVVIRHHLVNSQYDGKERLAMTQHLVKTLCDELPALTPIAVVI